MAFNLFVLALLLFVIGNFAFFFFAQNKYHKSLKTLRKGLYTLYISSIAVGLLLDEVQLSNWQFLITLTSIVIFLDISILITPSIMKIWNAEFKQAEEIENVITGNDKIQMAMMNRIGTMSDFIQKATGYFDEIPNDLTEEKRREQLEKYLTLYTSQYGLDVQIWDVISESIDPFLIPPEETDGLNEDEIKLLVEEYGLIKEIGITLHKIEQFNTFDFSKKFDSHVETLYQLAIVSFMEENCMIVPISINDNYMIIVLKGTKGELIEADAIHIVNLTYLFTMFR